MNEDNLATHIKAKQTQAQNVASAAGQPQRVWTGQGGPQTYV